MENSLKVGGRSQQQTNFLVWGHDKICGQVMDKLWTGQEPIVKNLWTSQKQIMEKDKQLMNKLRSNHDQAMSNLKISHKQEQV